MIVCEDDHVVYIMEGASIEVARQMYPGYEIVESTKADYLKHQELLRITEELRKAVHKAWTEITRLEVENQKLRDMC